MTSLNGWHVVSDTSYDGYEDIPRDVMQGYSTIAAEIVEQSDSRPDRPAYTHVFIQGGVGGLAAGLVSYLWEFPGCRPFHDDRRCRCSERDAYPGCGERHGCPRRCRRVGCSGSCWSDRAIAGLAVVQPGRSRWRFAHTAGQH
ncbi:hypothetical protein [Paraburkholderia azotifigens]|uniref:hypothetical protein n=1 Tax=Paraburkholderia azotifigens TaxID=2057004 RepID=UPI003CCC8305